MNEQYSLDEIKQLEISLMENPTDTDIMNQLAIGYLSCREADSFNKVDELLEKAFALKPTIKTATNYACQLITDCNDYDLGIGILQPFVDQNPKSFMPYNLIGYAYLMNGNFEKAHFNLKKAMTLSQREKASVIHNLAVCEIHLNKPQQALNLYEKAIAIMDFDNVSKFNKALCQIELGFDPELDRLIGEIKNSEAYQKPTAWVSCLELSQLCYLTNDMERAYELLIESPFSIDLLSYPEFSYLLLKYNDSKFDKLVQEEIQTRELEIVDLNKFDDEDYTEQERLTEKKKLTNEIETIKRLKRKLLDPPKIKLSALYMTTSCGCMFYDCKIHGTPFDD